MWWFRSGTSCYHSHLTSRYPSYILGLYDVAAGFDHIRSFCRSCGRSDKAPFQARMTVLLACPSLSGKSKHRSCQRALLATFPQESVASGRVWREQKKLWARCFNVCLSSELKMLIEGKFRDDLATTSCLGVAFEVFWWPPAMKSVPQWVDLCLSGEFCSKSLQRTNWCGVERVWRFSFFWICLLYFLTLWHVRQQD